MKKKNLLLTWIEPYRFYIFLAALAGVACAALNVVVSEILKQVINMASARNLKGIGVIIIAGVLVLIVGMISNYASTYMTGYFGVHIVRDIRKRMVTHLVTTKPDYMERSGFGDILARLTQDVDGISAFVENYLADCIYVPIMVFVFSIYLCYLQPVLFLATIGPLIFLVFLTTKLLTPVKLSQKRYSQMLGEANDNIKEACDGASVIKAFSMENTIFSRYEKKLTNCLHIAQRNDWLQYRIIPFSNLIYDLPIVTALLLGGIMTFQSKMSIGSLVAYVSLLKILIGPLSEVYQLWVNSKSAMANMERIQAIFTEPAEDDVAERIDINKCDMNHDNVFEINQLSFAYQEQQDVLHEINIVIPRGSRTAFVGMSGSGKSTLLKMLYRHYDGYEGKIKFYGHNMKELKGNAIREHIALISQTPFLFPVSIEDNIRVGRQGATRQEVENAAKMADCHEFIMNLPDGYQTIVGENGTSLSGGQMQRLSIARAVLKKADIYLLDEPTSALDPESERQVSNAIDEICRDKNKTVISVAHRLSTIKNYDQIILFDHGKIEEQGTHQQLIEKGGKYAEFYKAFES